MRIRLAAAGLLLAATPAVGLGAAPAIQDDRLPVVRIGEIPKRLDILAATGAKVTRVDLFWSHISPRRPASPASPSDRAYNWTRPDAILTGLRRRGIRPIVSVYSSPRWAAVGRRGPVAGQPFNPWAPARPADFGDFMQALATRYPFVRHYEIWNEPNIQLFFRPQRVGRTYASVPAYAGLVKAAYPRIKRANPRAVVIAGVAGPKGKSLADGVGAVDWIRALRSQRIPLDAYSQHIYPASPPVSDTKAIPSWNSINLLLGELNRFPGGRRKALYITEAGYTTARTPYRRVAFTQAQQAAYMRQMFALPQTRQRRVPAIVWFNLQDNANWPAGVLLANGRRKPSYAVFRSLTAGIPVPPGLR